MVNVLEGLYVVTALAAVAGVIQFVRGRRVSGRRFLGAAGVGALGAVLLYVLLGT